MPAGPRERVFDNPGKLAQLVSDSVITRGLQVDVIEVQRGEEDAGDTGAGMAVYLYGRPNRVAEGHYEKVHVLGIDVAAKMAAAILVVGTNTWGRQFSEPIDGMLRDPKTIPGLMTESGLMLPGAGAIDAIRRLRRS